MRQQQMAQSQQYQQAQLGQQAGQNAFQQSLQAAQFQAGRQDAANLDAYRNAGLDQRGDIAQQRDATQRYGIESRASTRLATEAMEAEQLARRLESQGNLAEAQHARNVALERMRQSGRMELAEKRTALKQQAVTTVQKTATSNNAILRQLGLKLQAATIKLHALEKRKEQMMGMDDPALDNDLAVSMQEINAVMGEISAANTAPVQGPPPVQAQPTQAAPTTMPTTQPAAPQMAQAPAMPPTTQPAAAAPSIPVGQTATNPQTGQRIRWNGQAWELVPTPSTQPASTTQPAQPPATQPVVPAPPPQRPGVITTADRQSIIPPGTRYGGRQQDQLGVTDLRMEMLGYKRVPLPGGAVVWQKPDGSFVDSEGNPVQIADAG